MKLGPIISFSARTIGAHRGAILRSCGSTETQTREMSQGCSGGHAESGSIGSSRGSTWLERRQKRHEDKERKHRKEESSLGKGSNQTHRTMSSASRHGQHNERDQEMEWLGKLVRDLELEARGWRQRKDRDNRERRDGNVGNRGKERSSQSGSRQFLDRSLS